MKLHTTSADTSIISDKGQKSIGLQRTCLKFTIIGI